MTTSSRTPEPGATRKASVAVEITCPVWCEVSPDEHATRLWANEGRCVHQTSVSVADPVGKRGSEEASQFCPPVELTLCVTANPSGREVESADVLLNGQESNLEQLLLVVRAIVDLDLLYRTTAGLQRST